MKPKVFVQESVVGFGFLSGLFLQAGVDPEGAILSAFWDVLVEFEPGLEPFRAIALAGLALISAVIELGIAYAVGRWLGIAAVALAFVGGVFIEASFGAWFLLAGIGLGFIAPSTGGRHSR